MKGLAKLIIVIGIILIILSMTGFVLLKLTDMNSWLVDSAISLNNSFGTTSYLSTSDRITIWLIQYRLTTLIIGIAGLILGIGLNVTYSDN